MDQGSVPGLSSSRATPATTTDTRPHDPHRRPYRPLTRKDAARPPQRLVEAVILSLRVMEFLVFEKPKTFETVVQPPTYVLRPRPDPKTLDLERVIQGVGGPNPHLSDKKRNQESRPSTAGLLLA